MKRIVSIITAGILSFIIYMALTIRSFNVKEISGEEVLAAVFISIFIGGLTHKLFITKDSLWIFKKNRLLFLLMYIVTYPYYLIKANFSVAIKALSPKLNINPSIVTVETELKSDYGLALLGNSITLTPGTITIDIYEHNGLNRLFVHCLDINDDEKNHATKFVAGSFESKIKKVFE